MMILGILIVITQSTYLMWVNLKAGEFRNDVMNYYDGNNK